MKKVIKLGLILIFLTVSLTYANESYKSKYVGQENRKIKSLSLDDIKELKKGAGWGLAKAAELNGYPGPSHVLKMKEKINLSNQQEKKIETVFINMKEKAIILGNKLIRLEEKLNSEFIKKTITKIKLNKLVLEIEKIRAQLRLVHLNTHLQMPDILNPSQVDLYNKLRGYSKEPCANIPEGHDSVMWKKHNGCK